MLHRHWLTILNYTNHLEIKIHTLEYLFGGKVLSVYVFNPHLANVFILSTAGEAVYTVGHTTRTILFKLWTMKRTYALFPHF